MVKLEEIRSVVALVVGIPVPLCVPSYHMTGQQATRRKGFPPRPADRGIRA